MNEQALTDALNQSIEWLAKGRTLADCLRAYPDLAEQLAPLLEAGLVVKRMPIKQSEIAAAQARVQQRIRVRQQRWTQTRLLLRSIAAVVVVGLGVFMLGQAPSIAVLLNTLQGTAISNASPTPTATPTATVTAQITATPESRQPTIQITRYTTPTQIRPTVARTLPPTVQSQPRSTTPPSATDDHGSATDDHGSGSDDSSGKGGS